MRTNHSCGPIYEIGTIDQLKESLNKCKNPIIVGGGSNILFTQDTDREIIKIQLKGRGIVDSNETTVSVTIAAGEDWHETVLWALSHNWGGIENLSLIPGLCGAAPMQNIGAYGVEIDQVLLWVEILNRLSGKLERLSNQDCEFGYRDSVFKNRFKNQVIVTKICLQLTRPGHHQLNTSYGVINDELSKNKISTSSIHEVSKAVITIRKSKLPDPKEIPNTGSFFKNPIISISKFKDLRVKYSMLPSYPVNEDHVKVPAGWLIDQAGWKGKRLGAVGVHDRQALVLANYDSGSGHDILNLAREIQDDIMAKYGIEISPEVNIY